MRYFRICPLFILSLLAVFFCSCSDDEARAENGWSDFGEMAIYQTVNQCEGGGESTYRYQFLFDSGVCRSVSCTIESPGAAVADSIYFEVLSAEQRNLCLRSGCRLVLNCTAQYKGKTRMQVRQMLGEAVALPATAGWNDDFTTCTSIVDNQAGVVYYRLTVVYDANLCQTAKMEIESPSEEVAADVFANLRAEYGDGKVARSGLLVYVDMTSVFARWSKENIIKLVPEMMPS